MKELSYHEERNHGRSSGSLESKPLVRNILVKPSQTRNLPIPLLASSVNCLEKKGYLMHKSYGFRSHVTFRYLSGLTTASEAQID